MPSITFTPSKPQQQDRKPAVAGMFYPGRQDELKRLLRDLFAKAVARQAGQDEVCAVIVPHAGYVYSGEVAASGFNQIDPERDFDNVFILGPSHRVGFEGAAVYCAGDFTTPLGTVKVNRELGDRLTKASPLFSSRIDAHAVEHSVEVEVPFLQYHLQRPFRIVPIVLGINRPETCHQIGQVLKPFLNSRNLFVLSTDFSHYPAYDDAVTVDKAVAEAIMANSPEQLTRTMRHYENAGIANLATSLCGSSVVLTFLAMTAGDAAIRFHPVQYMNSGDMPMTDRSRVVGYHAIAVTRQPDGHSQGQGQEGEGFTISATDKEILLGIARNTVASTAGLPPGPTIDIQTLSDTLKTPCGAFVTLKKHGQLRGCIGRFDATLPLYAVVQEMAMAAASQDYRFKPVTDSEVKELSIDISVLTPMRRIHSIAEFELGRHGIYIRKGSRSGTFLPQVAHESGWSRDEFLGHCARDKAGIGWDGWRDAELYVYEALVFGEE